MINKKIGSFILIVLFNTFLITTNAYQATVDGYNAVTNEDHLEDYYVDDLLNHPDVINHPAFPILERRALGFQNPQRSSKLDFIRDIFHLARRSFSSRQGFGGLAAALRGQGSSMISLGLGTVGTVGTVYQASQIQELRDDLNTLTAKVNAINVPDVSAFLTESSAAFTTVRDDGKRVCTVVKTVGTLDVASASTTDTTTGTELNALITAVELVATPTCTSA